jgi:hypothetical protein
MTLHLLLVLSRACSNYSRSKFPGRFVDEKFNIHFSLDRRRENLSSEILKARHFRKQIQCNWNIQYL